MSSISVFEMIKVGIGPSSSHTMGPWLACDLFIKKLQALKVLDQVSKIKITCYGSLAKTGLGHGTDLALILGLAGYDFITIDPNSIDHKINLIKNSKRIKFAAIKEIDFDYQHDLIFNFKETLAFHSNGMKFHAELEDQTIIEEKYYSLGGGFVATENYNSISQAKFSTLYQCDHASDITKYCEKLNISISELIFINEQAWRTREETHAHALSLWNEMKECAFRGVVKSGYLPGGLNVKRRAFEINQKLLNQQVFSNSTEWLTAIKNGDQSFNTISKWITCFALAINEENASFGRVVTAPTNGAAGVLPAVLLYAYCFTANFNDQQIVRFILTAGLIATLFKKNATISAAMGGCQAEIGVSSSMAAAALTEALGGTPGQVLMAAEIAMEHHLGLTCDPVAGLVQIPCIERNSMGAIKAITASNIALDSDPISAKISLDDVIKTMWETAKDMHSHYKETSEGGLAIIPVNITEC